MMALAALLSVQSVGCVSLSVPARLASENAFRNDLETGIFVDTGDTRTVLTIWREIRASLLTLPAPRCPGLPRDNISRRGAKRLRSRAMYTEIFAQMKKQLGQLDKWAPARPGNMQNREVVRPERLRGIAPGARPVPARPAGPDLL